MENKNVHLGEAPIGKLMKGYAIPCIISLLVGALYNIVDQIFIANASYLGSYGNAANTVVFPLTVVALAIAVMVGDGCCAFVSMALGQEEPAQAKRCVGNAVVLTVAASLVLTAVYLCKWGMMGAAVATVIGQVATAILALGYLLHMHIIKPRPRDYALNSGICGRMLSLGITSFLSQISLVAAMAAINNMLRKYGALDPIFGQTQYAQIPMAVVGIVMKFFQIVISIVVGMAAGCIPIVGFNMGAGKSNGSRPSLRSFSPMKLWWDSLPCSWWSCAPASSLPSLARQTRAATIRPSQSRHFGPICA